MLLNVSMFVYVLLLVQLEKVRNLSLFKLSLPLIEQYIKSDLTNLQELNWDEMTEEVKLDGYKFRIDVKESAEKFFPFISQLGWGYKICQLKWRSPLSRGVTSTSMCALNITLNHQSCSFGEYGVPIHCHYSYVL